MKLLLSKPGWHRKGNLLVTGFIRDGARYLEDESLAGFFASATTPGDFEKCLREANGFFSVIIEKEGEIWVAVDRLRTHPLFYVREEGGFVIGDDGHELLRLKQVRELDSTAWNSFLASGYVINNLTLCRDIFQVEAGSFIILNREVTAVFYHRSSSEPEINIDKKEAAGILTEKLHQVFTYHFSALKHKFIAIPLSGGYDSRLVAAMASTYHPENLICYTYGAKENPEVAPAREVSRRLGLRWINIIYDEELIKGFHREALFQEYFPYVSNLTGMFFLQDYFAVKYLKENSVVPPDTVFMSGYSGDFIAGSYLTPDMNKKLDVNDIARIILREYFRLIKPGREQKQDLLKAISARIDPGIPAWKIIEEWDMKERHAKFIVNSAKLYPFFGFSYVFPLWDNDLVDFMLNLPWTLRFDRKLYEHVLRDKIFREKGLNLEHETNPKPVQKSMQRFRESVKEYIPRKLVNIIIKQASPIFYDEITSLLRQDMDPGKLIAPRQSNYYNSYIVQWYLQKVSGLLSR